MEDLKIASKVKKQVIPPYSPEVDECAERGVFAFRAIATRYDKTARHFLSAFTSLLLSFGLFEDTP